MARVDPLGNRCQHVVKIHIRRMDPSVTNVEESVLSAQRLFGSHGIYFDVASAESVAMDESDRKRLAVLDTECVSGEDSSEQAELFAKLVVADTAITAIFVKAIATYTGMVFGCAAQAPRRFGRGVLLRPSASPWILAHEVGHVLLTPKYKPTHVLSSTNIMSEWSYQLTESSRPRFDPHQLGQIRRSPYLLPC